MTMNNISTTAGLKKVLKLKQIFTKKKVAGKTPFFVIGPFCTHHSIVLTLASHMTVFYANDAFSILLLSTEKQYSCFLEKVFVSRKRSKLFVA